MQTQNRQAIWTRDAMPGEWLEYADELWDAAEVVWKNPANGIRVVSDVDPTTLETTSREFHSSSRPYILLIGFALENLLKGILVTLDPGLITVDSLPKDLKTHKLLILAEKIPDLKISDDERHVIRTAEEALPYWGRYPVPLHPNQVLPEVAVDESFRDTYQSLHIRLGRMIYVAIKDGWDSGTGPRHESVRFERYEDEAPTRAS